jgi:hypothetical protein
MEDSFLSNLVDGDGQIHISKGHDEEEMGKIVRPADVRWKSNLCTS